MTKRISDCLQSDLNNHQLVMVGNLQGKENFVVNGRVTGDSDVQGAIMLERGSHWTGNITADVVIIQGILEGRVWARRKLEIGATGRVTGDLLSPNIAIAEGAVLSGNVLGVGRVLRFHERRRRD